MPPTPYTADRPAAGISMIVLGLFLFSLQDIVIKLFSDQYSLLQIVFIRGVVAIFPMLIIAVVANMHRGLMPVRPGLTLLRGLFGFLSYVSYYMAIAALPLADVVAIVFTAPIFATALSALLFREPVGPRRWVAVLLGFIAVAIVIGPSGNVVNIGALLALTAALTYASMTLTTRYIGGEESPTVMSLVSMLVFLAGSGAASLIVTFTVAAPESANASIQFLLRPWVFPDAGDFVLMVLLGLNAVLGFYFLTKAYCVAPVSVLAPFEYTYILWAVLFGLLLWNEVPALTTLAGVTLLVGSSLYILRRELSFRDEPGSDEPVTAHQAAAAESDLQDQPSEHTAISGISAARLIKAD